MKLFIGVVLLVIIAVHLYICFRSWNALEILPQLRLPAVIIIILLTLLFITQQLFNQYLPFELSRTFAFIGSSWVYCIILTLLSLIIIDLVRLLNHFFHFYPEVILSNYPKTKIILMVSIIAAITFSYILGFLNFTSPHITDLNIDIVKNKGNIEASQTPIDSLNIVMISDMHLGYTVNKSKLKKYVELINKQQPDMILLVGDIIDMSIVPVIDQQMHEELLQLKSRLGIYAVAGNHEFIGGGYKQKMDYYRKLGFVVLEDSVALVDNKYYIVGRKDKTDKNRLPTIDLTANLDKAKPIILLDHQPFDLQQSVDAGIDLQFSGHTHNGQFFPINLIVKFVYEKAYGYLKKDNTQFYISSGLGLWGPPVRVGTKSEMVVVKLKVY